MKNLKHHYRKKYFILHKFSIATYSKLIKKMTVFRLENHIYLYKINILFMLYKCNIIGSFIAAMTIKKK